MTNPNEARRFETFLNFLGNHRRDIYTFRYADGTEEEVRYDGNYETNNNLELDDPDYEEFWALLFCRLSGQLLEIDYHTLPEAVFCNGERVI